MKRLCLVLLATIVGLNLASGCASESKDYASLSVAAKQTTATADLVQVRKVVALSDGYVAVFADEAGVRGALLGVAPVSAGTTEDVDVILARTLLGRETLHAGLFVEDSGDAVFDAVLDSAATGSGDKPVEATFVAELEPVIEADDQQVTQPDAVVVALVLLADPGIVAIHAGTAADPTATEIIGRAAVEAGAHDDVVVTLDRAVVPGETLKAYLHKDLASDGQLDFPGADEPYGTATAPVMASFVVTYAPSIAAADQEVTTMRKVTLAVVTTPQKGYAVVYADDAAGGLGAVIGYTAVGEGGHQDVEVSLERDLVHGETLHAVLHYEDNDTDTFDAGVPGADEVAQDAEGQDVQATFVVTVAAAIQVVNQKATNEVTLSLVSSPIDGLAVIHADAGGDPAEAWLGAVTVTKGVAKSVKVPLTQRDAVVGETLWVMLHNDGGGDGAYLDQATDTPYLTPKKYEVIKASFVVLQP